MITVSMDLCLNSFDYCKKVPCNAVLCNIRFYFCYQAHQQMSILSTLAQPLHSGDIGNSPQLFASSVLDTHLLVSYLFGLLCGSHGKYTGVVCHSLLQWIMFCQNSLCCDLSVLGGPVQHGS